MDINVESGENSNFLEELIEDVVALGNNRRHSKDEVIKNKQALDMMTKVSSNVYRHSLSKIRENSLLY